RPQSARMVLLPAALLQHEAAALVHQEDREGPVQQAGAMHRGLALRSGRTVAFVDQDQRLVGVGAGLDARPDAGLGAAHGLTWRMSLTRTALPWERGTSPGALSTTSQVMPTIDLMWLRTSVASFATNGSSDGAGEASSTSRMTASIGPSRVSTI